MRIWITKLSPNSNLVFPRLLQISLYSISLSFVLTKSLLSASKLTSKLTSKLSTTKLDSSISSIPNRTMPIKTFVMDAFCIRQFNNPEYLGTQVNFDIQAFEDKINDLYESGSYPLVDGYAPFCKHLFVPNFANVECGYTEISSENKHLLECTYEARKEQELPVLVQFIDRSRIVPPLATHLDIILYSREQIIKENEAMGVKAAATDSPWGIISVKGQLNDFELPMQPITMMRNALGKEYGGSGVALDEQKYRESVAFWTKHVAIK